MKWCLMVQIAICIFTANGAKSASSTAALPTASSVDGNECLINVGSSSVGGSHTSVPDTFTYVCKKDGNIAINISNLMSQGEFNIRGIEPSPKVLLTYCQNFTCTVSDKIVTVTPVISISNCQHGSPILLEFDKLNSRSNGVAGGQSSKLFKLVCSSFNESASYALNPSAFSVAYTVPTVTYETLDIAMTLKSGGNNVTSTVVGEKLKLGISIQDSKYKIKPIDCEATNGKENADLRKIKLWKEGAANSQSADLEIFDETWSVNSGRNWSVNVFAFRFVDTDELVITCNVRLCFKGGVDDNLCDKGYYPNKHRRSISETDHVKNRRITKTIHVYDVQTSHSAGLTDLVSVAVISFILAGGRLLT